MDKEAFMKELLRRYQVNFDIYRDYELRGKKYPAYAWFFSHSEKYVLRQEAQLWAIKAYEHVLFVNVDKLDLAKLQEIEDVIENQMEPDLVRKGEKYPEKDHMYSYLTVAIISDQDIDQECATAIRKYKYDKGYMFNFRGHSEGHLICISMESGKTYFNKRAKRLQKLFEDTYTKTKNFKVVK